MPTSLVSNSFSTNVDPQEVVQYNISTKFEFGEDGALLTACPHCKASSPLKSKTNPVKCSYCHQEYIVPKKLLDFL